MNADRIRKPDLTNESSSEEGPGGIETKRRNVETVGEDSTQRHREHRGEGRLDMLRSRNFLLIPPGPSFVEDSGVRTGFPFFTSVHRCPSVSIGVLCASVLNS